MNDNFNGIRENLYDLEMDFEQIVMLAEIIKNFGDYSDEVSGGAEKIVCLAEILTQKCNEYKTMLCEIIPVLQSELSNDK